MALSTWPIMADARHRHFAFAEVALRFGIHVSNCGDFHDIRATAALTREAEDAGWGGFFLWHHIQYGKSTYHPTVDPPGLHGSHRHTDPRDSSGATGHTDPALPPLEARPRNRLHRPALGRSPDPGCWSGFPADAEFEHFGADADPRLRAQKLDEELEILAGCGVASPLPAPYDTTP